MAFKTPIVIYGNRQTATSLWRSYNFIHQKVNLTCFSVKKRQQYALKLLEGENVEITWKCFLLIVIFWPFRYVIYIFINVFSSSTLSFVKFKVRWLKKLYGLLQNSLIHNVVIESYRKIFLRKIFLQIPTLVCNY